MVFWQWANQTFNATVNYTNRNGRAAKSLLFLMYRLHFYLLSFATASVSVSKEQLGIAYACACTASVVTALGFNKIIASSPRLSAGVVGRFVPLAAVAAANCINIPLMRQEELKNGISIATADGAVVGQSSKAASDAIIQVLL